MYPKGTTTFFKNVDFEIQSKLMSQTSNVYPTIFLTWTRLKMALGGVKRNVPFRLISLLMKFDI